ncbi:helix-turn-helix transcriptional regulator [Cellulomonas terrae]|uniref:Transcriptional regulator n=1 Tax=Cellulomonas terrae TaxID=311234 RepID=A0A511JME2_9CELL|nr:helix-turn-helix transcriptional regulator [Cellulomonas terrae]GEL99190.1 transcriptional regulator [Cellulomonas terrae]
MTPPESGPLGEFLQASRARISPAEAGVTLYGDRRRVPGLRREELAMLAGVSSSYYTRLEQGQSRHASPQVLDALATALRLDDAERAHLHRLAASGGRRRPARKPPVERADPALLELLAALGDVPALVLGRRSDVLAWNPVGHALLASHLPAVGSRPNMATLVFLDPETRDLYADWRAKAGAVVGNLRLVAGAHPDDAALALLVGSLTVASPEFASLWADHRVRPCATAQYELRHPLVGRLVVTQQTLRSVEHPDQTLVTHTTPAGSTSAEGLTLLTQLVLGAGDENRTRAISLGS